MAILKHSDESIPALVIGGDVSALNVVRSLGRRGIKVYVMGNDPREYGASSRYGEFVYCEKLTDEECVVSRLLEVSRHFKTKVVLYCTSDLHVLHVSRNRKLLKKSYDFVLPDHQVIEMLMNKKDFYEFAAKHGYPIPETFFSNNRTDLEGIAQNISYPCIVKPLYRTRYWSEYVPPQKKVMKMESLTHLEQELQNLRAMDQPLILQKWIPGGDQQIYFCLAYVDKQGKSLALLAGRKLRQYPSLTGVTSLAESIINPRMVEMTLEILNTAGCLGLCSVEYKYDASDGSFKITEPTVGRVDLQEGISTQAGLDIPFIAYQDAVGISQFPQRSYEAGMKWINEPFEFNSFLTDARRNGHGMGSFFHSYKGRRSFALLSADDSRPFLHFLIWAGKRGFRYLRNVVLSK